MITTECQTALKNMEKNRIEKEKQIQNDIEKPLSEKTKDVVVKAFQIGKHALVEWGIIIDDYNDYKTNYNINHNIMVKNQSQIVEAVDKLIDKLVNNDADFARYKHKRENTIFPLLVLLCSKSCLRNGIKKFNNIMNNGSSVELIKKMLEIEGIDELYHVDGISKETEKNFDDFIDTLLNR